MSRSYCPHLRLRSSPPRLQTRPMSYVHRIWTQQTLKEHPSEPEISLGRESRQSLPPAVMAESASFIRSKQPGMCRFEHRFRGLVQVRTCGFRSSGTARSPRFTYMRARLNSLALFLTAFQVESTLSRGSKAIAVKPATSNYPLWVRTLVQCGTSFLQVIPEHQIL